MTDEPLAGARPRKAGPGPLKRLWRRVRVPLAQSPLARGATASALAQALRFIKLTNPVVAGSSDFEESKKYQPGILALWHGQHLLAPAVYPRGMDLLVMVSRSADAELNARVVEKLGIEAVRGSGGRDLASHMGKGGAHALIALKRALDAGRNVAMIADIPHGKPREAGMGIVTLARLSGRPIVGAAVATSRRRVIEKSWDRTAINLPFGRMAIRLTDPIFVPRDAEEAEMESKRRELTAALNAVTEQAYRLVDGAR